MRGFILFFAWMVACPLTAQSLKVVYNGTDYAARDTSRTILGRQRTVWIFTMDSVEYYILDFDLLKALVLEMEKQQDSIRYWKDVVAVKDRLIDRYQRYESAAERHIAKQEQMLTRADSLYRGYRGLYQDLKRLATFPTVALLPAVGLVRPPESDWRPAFSLGLLYRRWQGHVQFGSGFRGLMVGIRFP